MRRATRRRRCTVTRGTGRSRRRWAPRPGRSRCASPGTATGRSPRGWVRPAGGGGDGVGWLRGGGVARGSGRLSQLDEMIVSLYGGGMTVRDIEHHLVSTLGVDLSHETVSNITEEIADEVLAWQSRPLEVFY